MSEDWEDELSRLRRRVSSLESRWEEEKSSLEGYYSSLDTRVDRLRDRVNGLDGGQDRAVGRVAALEEQMAALARQVQGLERLLRAQAGEEPVVLDAVDDRSGSLCAAVREMYEERELLLTPVQRAALRKTVADHDQELQRIAQARQEMVEASRELARVPLESGEHAAAAMKFRRARNTVDAARPSQLEQRARYAASAAEQLAEDKEATAAASSLLQAGQQAEAQLLIRVRTRIADEVAGAGLLPVWFTTVFGSLPDRQDPEGWLEDATAAVLYRVLYCVSDPVLLLGSRPDEDEHSAQWGQYTKLQRRVEQWAG